MFAYFLITLEKIVNLLLDLVKKQNKQTTTKTNKKKQKKKKKKKSKTEQDRYSTMRAYKGEEEKKQYRPRQV